MTQRTTIVRTALAVAALSTLGFAVDATAAVKAKVPACGTWSDPAGDSSFRGTGAGADAALDITKVTFKSDGKVLSAAIEVPAFKQQPVFGTGNRFQVHFTLAGHETYLYYNDSSTRDAQANAFLQAGVYVDGTRVEGSETLVNRSSAGTTQIVSIGLPDLAGAVGTKITSGTVAKAGLVRALAQVPGTFNEFDVATADAALSLPLWTCK